MKIFLKRVLTKPEPFKFHSFAFVTTLFELDVFFFSFREIQYFNDDFKLMTSASKKTVFHTLSFSQQNPLGQNFW